MNESSMRWPLVVVAGAGLVAVGVLLGRGVWAPSSQPSAPLSQPSAPRVDAHAGMNVPPAGGGEDASSANASPRGLAPRAPRETDVRGATPLGFAQEHPDVVVTLTPEMIARAGIKTGAVTAGASTMSLRIPGVVQPNAYKEVAVTSLVSGRITQVRAELGQRVMLGESLATVYSPELTEAQTNVIAIKAEHNAHNQRQARAQRLFAIGAVSRQELDALEAERTRLDAAQEAARARLALLGIPEERAQRLATPLDVVTTIDVKAPLTGVVTKRNANTGLNIDTSTPLFTIVDLDTVWVIGDLYERDFGKVRVGSPVAITSASYPGLTLRGRVGYIDPQVQEDTRTAKLRVEVPNAGGRLRFGVYVDVSVGDASARAAVFVPKAAVQIVGSDSVVYLASEHDHGRFMERKIEVGEASGDRVRVVAGLEPGDIVVTDGAFFLRAERERMSRP